MSTNNFTTTLSELTEEAMLIALEYVQYSSEIECIYVYISLEFGGMYLVFYRINGHLAFQHQLNEYSSRSYDISSANQDEMNISGNELAERIRRCFLDAEQEVPTYLKMTYEPQVGKFDCKINYGSHLDLDNMIDEIAFHFRWFAEEGGKLEPWMEI